MATTNVQETQNAAPAHKTGNPVILALANHIGRKKPGAKDAYDYDAPEYRILEPVVTDDMAAVCMTMNGNSVLCGYMTLIIISLKSANRWQLLPGGIWQRDIRPLRLQK